MTPGARPAKPARSTAPAEGSDPPGPRPAYLVRGDDAALVSGAVRRIVHEVCGDDDPAMVTEDHGGPGSDGIDVDAVVDALATPPFLAPRRIVVVRDAGRLPASDAGRIAEALADPVPGVVLVLAGGGGTVPNGLVQAVRRAGALVDAKPGVGRSRSTWIDQQLADAPVRLTRSAAAELVRHLGEDLARIGPLMEVLAATYGSRATVDADELRPFLGTEGGVAPWDLTDAIDRGDPAGGLRALARMLGPGGFHPLAVLAICHRHYQTMLRLDGVPVSSAEDAAALIGARSVFPVKKAMEQGRRLGSARLGRAIELLAGADLDLRGRTGLPGDAVMEILVARLARLSARRR